MFDYCVIGGGVVGSAILNKLTRLGKSCVLVEKENDVGFGASRANSALIHSGIDCKPGTLKAKLNVRGCEMFPALAKRLKVPYSNCGHLIIGNDKQRLQELLERGRANGVKGLKIIGRNEIRSLEPNISEEIVSAIFIPSGGIISSYELSVAFCEEAIINGATVLREFVTKKVTKKSAGIFEVFASDGRTIECKYIINCAGAGYNEIAKVLKSEVYPLTFRRGEYYILDTNCQSYVSHPIFPLPTKESKGILVSRTIHGNILVGPTSYESDTSTKTTKAGLNKIKQEVLVNFPSLPFRQNIRVFSGVRTISGEDFIIEKSRLQDGVINIAGICSPGLSACPAIAEMVANMLGLDASKEKKALKERTGITKISQMDYKSQEKLIKKNPDFGKVVCKCENISLGEIKEALTSPLPALSVDAVKRRTRAGMGRCQGGFCIFSVMEEISKATNSRLENICKDSTGSQILKCDIKPSVKK